MVQNIGQSKLKWKHLKKKNKFCEIIKILYYIKNLAYNEYRCDVYNINLNNNKIIFELELKKRWCNIFKDWHYDDKFYFFIKIINYKYYIYNYCITCTKEEIIDISLAKSLKYFT